jgi:two-component sensor histidine kinase
VQGIAHQTFKDAAASPESQKAFEGRLFALGVAHSLLTQANWENASLERLAFDTLNVGAPNRERVSLSGPRIMLPPKEAVAIVMALHELCTNAMKYGALSNDTGRIALGWSRADGAAPRLRLVWRGKAARRFRRRRAAALARCCSNARCAGSRWQRHHRVSSRRSGLLD